MRCFIFKMKRRRRRRRRRRRERERERERERKREKREEGVYHPAEIRKDQKIFFNIFFEFLTFSIKVYKIKVGLQITLSSKHMALMKGCNHAKNL